MLVIYVYLLGFLLSLIACDKSGFGTLKISLIVSLLWFIFWTAVTFKVSFKFFKKVIS